MEMAQTKELLVIGVDVSKAKLDLAWGSNGRLETIENADQDITRKLIAQVKDPAKTLIVMEGTAGYESLLVVLLHQANLACAIVDSGQKSVQRKTTGGRPVPFMVLFVACCIWQHSQQHGSARASRNFTFVC